MTTGTEEFGPAEYGAGDQEPPYAGQAQGPAQQPRPIPAQPGPAPRRRAEPRGGYGAQQPAAPLDVQLPEEQLPWLGGGSVGYAEAVFGANSQAATSASPIGPRSRLAPQGPGVGPGVGPGGQVPQVPQQMAPHQSELYQSEAAQGDLRQPEPRQRPAAPQQGVPRQAAPPQPPPAQHQVASYDAPTTEFFPGAFYDEPFPPQDSELDQQQQQQAPQHLPGQGPGQQFGVPVEDFQQQAQVQPQTRPQQAQQPPPPQHQQQQQPQHQQQQQPEYVDYDSQAQQSLSNSGSHWTARPDQPEQSVQQTSAHSSGAHSVPAQAAQAQPVPSQAAQAAPAQPAQRRPATIQPGLPHPSRNDPARPHGLETMAPPRRGAQPARAASAQPGPAASPIQQGMADLGIQGQMPGQAPQNRPGANQGGFGSAESEQLGADQSSPHSAPPPDESAANQVAAHQDRLNQGAANQSLFSRPAPNHPAANQFVDGQIAPQQVPAEPAAAAPVQPAAAQAQAGPAPAVSAPVPGSAAVGQAPPVVPRPLQSRTATRVGAAATRPAVRQPEPQPAQPQVHPAEPVNQANLVNQAGPGNEQGDLDEADELIVPWQAVATAAQAQPAEAGAVDQAPAEAADPDRAAASDAAQDQAEDIDDQSSGLPLVPRGTRRRSAQQYLADDQEGEQEQGAPQSTVKQPERQAPQADQRPASSVSAFASAQQLRQLSTPLLRQTAAAAGPVGTAGPDGSAVPATATADPAALPVAPGLIAPGLIGPGSDRAPGYDHETLAAVYRVIHERRDVRNDFLPDPVPTEMLTRILEAAHTAPSVGFSQPWDFLVIRDQVTRESIHDLAVRQRRAYAASLPKARAKAFDALKVEAILETPVNIVVTCDPTRGGRHTLGRYSQPMMAPFSSCLAVENLWLAARAEGLGVGWVSFFDERELAAVLDLPNHLQIVAYLCVGFVSQFPTEPELAGSGWAKRRPLSWAVHEETFGHRAMPGAEPISLLNETIDAVRPLDPVAMAQARDRQNRMTKPPGSLGALEAVSEQLAGLAGVCPPPLLEPAALAVFAGDHGVHAQGVTPWPQEVTAQMVGNFLAGGAVINAFAKQVGAEVCVVDVGVAADLTGAAGLIPRKIRYGTGDMTQGPAMSRSEAIEAVEAGIETARDLIAAGNRCLLTGDMGIANTTASAALIATFTGASPAQVTGYGTGIDEQTYAHKVEVVHRALQLHQPDPQDPIGVLAAFGGLEHAALAGFILGAAALRIPVILDGVIAGAAALVAQALAPESTAACVAGHRSAEPGHALALEALEINPLIDLELRLGEGSGAALALPLVGASVRALREVATFDDAGVAEVGSAANGAANGATVARQGTQAIAAAQARARGQQSAQTPVQSSAPTQAQVQAQGQGQGQGPGQAQGQPQPRIPQARSADGSRSATAAPTPQPAPGADA